MTNNLVLPLLALILAVLSALFPTSREDKSLAFPKDEIRRGSIVAAVFVLLFAGATMVWPDTFSHGVSIALALAIGALVGVLSSAADATRTGFALGMAVLGAAFLHLGLIPPAAIGAAQLAYVVGVLVAAFATSGKGGFEGGYLATLAAATTVSVDFLGREAAGSPSASMSGVVLGLAALFAAVCSGIVATFAESGLTRKGIAFIALALLGYLAAWQYLGNADLANLWLGGAVVGGAIHLILAGENRAEPFRFILCSVIWIAASTVAFGIHLGYGMAAMVFSGVAVLLLFGDVRALMTLAVPVAILIYRMFRELFPEEARALDIGQHYTMIGLAIGALLPLLPIEWARARNLDGAKQIVAKLVWLLILIGSPVAASILLGSKGAIGIVVGLSFASIVEGLRGTVSLAPSALATGIGCATVLSYSWLGDWTDLERSAKIRAVIVVSAALLALSAVLFGLSRRDSTTSST